MNKPCAVRSFFLISSLVPSMVAVMLALAPRPAAAAGRTLIPFEADDSLETLQLKIQMNGYDFTVAHNPIFDMPKEQKAAFLRRRAPAFPRARTVSDDIGPLSRYLGKTLPTAFCWTNVSGHTYIGAIRNQGSCGSCYSFGACAAAEGTYNYAMGRYDANCIDLSESFIAWCLGSISPYSAHFGGCDGADYDYYELTALTETGVCYESSFPYVETDPGTCTHWGDPKVVFKEWHRVPCNDIDAIKTAIMTYGVVDAAVNVESAFEGYDSGIYSDTATNCNGSPCYYTESNHAISLVGWNDNGGNGYWILRNSWGTSSWGEKGYMRISWRAAGVGCAVCYLVYEAANPPPNPPTARGASPTNATDFTARWIAVTNATGYQLDVATNAAFSAGSGSGGTEGFDNYPETGSSYANGTFAGADGSTWTYAQCRGDVEINAETPTLGKDRSPQAYLTSGTIGGGCGSLSFKYRRAFSSSLNCDVLLNGSLLTTLSGGDGTTQTYNNAAVNLAGNFVLTFTNKSGGGQISIDDITWTGYGASGNQFVPGYQSRLVGNVTNASVTGLTAGVAYYYRVRATNTAGVSGNSSTVTVTTASGDTDNDHIPDTWEQQYFSGSTNASPAADPDGDGLNNLQEYILDTNPTNAGQPTARFEADALLAGDDNALRFSASTARYYSVLYATNLQGSIIWNALVAGQKGTNATMTVVDPADVNSRYYRIKVRDTP